jgi:hypothetical protein
MWHPLRSTGPAVFVAGTVDGFVPMLLVPCLEKGEALEVVPPVVSGVSDREQLSCQWMLNRKRPD